MTPPLKAIIASVVVQICVLHLRAQGTIVFNDAAILPLDGVGPCLTLTNSIDPSQGRYGLFAISIAPLGGSQFTFSYAGIAEEYGLFQAVSGTVIDPAFAASTTPLVSNNGVDPGSSLQTFSIGQSRYFGYWDDRPVSGNGVPDANDNYGWVLITRTASGLQVSSSATALGGGIIAGTLTQVPEPAPIGLVVLGICLMLCRGKVQHFWPVAQPSGFRQRRGHVGLLRRSPPARRA